MIERLFGPLTLLFVSTQLLTAKEDYGATPEGLPPIFATAVVENASGKNGNDDTLEIKLSIPKATWQVVGEIVPKRSWPKLHVDSRQVTMTLAMRGPSALSPSRIFSLQGEELDVMEWQPRLKSETPVLVSVSGEMIAPYYLKLMRDDTLIIILGPRDGSPVPELLPSRKAD